MIFKISYNKPAFRHLFHFINIILCISLIIISSTNFEEMLGNRKASRTLKGYPLGVPIKDTSQLKCELNPHLI